MELFLFEYGSPNKSCTGWATISIEPVQRLVDMLLGWKSNIFLYLEQTVYSGEDNFLLVGYEIHQYCRVCDSDKNKKVNGKWLFYQGNLLGAY